MSDILVSDLYSSESKLLLSSLGTEESKLVQGAIDRALLARRISDGRRKHCGVSHPNDKPRKNYDDYFDFIES